MGLMLRLTIPVSAPSSSEQNYSGMDQAQPAGTTRSRSHRIQNRKDGISGGVNVSLRLARRLIISRRGLAIAEPGEEEEEEALEMYRLTFKKPLPKQIKALAALAKSSTVKGATCLIRPALFLVSA